MLTFLMVAAPTLLIRFLVIRAPIWKRWAVPFSIVYLTLWAWGWNSMFQTTVPPSITAGVAIGYFILTAKPPKRQRRLELDEHGLPIARRRRY